MSKSPRDVLVSDWRIGKAKLSLYTHLNSPKKFTQPQFFACLVSKNFLRTDYRGVVEHLRDNPSLTEAIELTKVPHFTTLQKVSKRLRETRRVQRLLAATVAEQMRRRKHVAKKTLF